MGNFFISNGKLYGTSARINVDTVLDEKSNNAISNAAVAEALKKTKGNKCCY